MVSRYPENQLKTGIPLNLAVFSMDNSYEVLTKDYGCDTIRHSQKEENNIQSSAGTTSTGTIVRTILVPSDSNFPS